MCWVFIAAASGFSPAVVSGGCSSLRCMCLSLRWLLLLQSAVSRCTGFSSCSCWPQWFWCFGLVAPWHVVGSSRTWNLCPLQWQADFYPLYHQGSSSPPLVHNLYNPFLFYVSWSQWLSSNTQNSQKRWDVTLRLRGKNPDFLSCFGST